MSEAQLWLAVGTVAGSVITAIFGGGTALLGLLLKYRRDKQQDQAGEQWKIIDRQEKQIARLEAQVRDMADAHAECRQESAELRLHLRLLHDYAKRQYTAMAGRGIEIEPPPELPPLEPETPTKD